MGPCSTLRSRHMMTVPLWRLYAFLVIVIFARALENAMQHVKQMAFGSGCAVRGGLDVTMRSAWSESGC